MGKLEDWMVDRAEARVPREEDDSEELLLLRVKLECRTMFMRLWQTIAAALFTGLVTGVASKILFK